MGQEEPEPQNEAISSDEQVRDKPEEKPQKPYETILAQQIRQANLELARPARGLLLSSLAAGLELGVGPFLMAVLSSLTRGVYARPAVELLVASAYAVGFILVVVGRSELFTEHTALAVQPVLAREASVLRLMRLWGLVLVGNLVGAALFSLFAAYLGPALGVMEREAIGEMAHNVIKHPSGTLLLSAVMAGWMMGLVAWVATSARETISQVVLVGLITLAIGLAHLHHSIAGSIEVLMGVFIGQGASVADFGRFFVLSVLGNAVGGSVFVALLKHGHVRHSS
ncbi:MAG: formate/nitrite transporter family protein [Hyalangium sp.]|uniref:formate/nitrite transporter family protein n=1 Tax=Hyalangium sp. TaxID=2028555 RepID=UPI003899A9F0